MITDDVLPEDTAVESNDDGTVSVTLPGVGDETPDEVFNLVPGMLKSLDKKVLDFVKKLAAQVIDDFHDDWDSCSGWRKKRLNRAKLLYGDLDPKELPFQDCANINVPVMLERVLRLVHRLYSEMFPDTNFVFNVIPCRSIDRDRAEILTLHGNWQIRTEIEDFFKQCRRALWEFVTNGDCTMHSFRNIEGHRNRHELLTCEEFVIPFVWKTTALDYSDVPRKTRIVRKFKRELLTLERKGIYCQIDKVVGANKDDTAEAQGKKQASFESDISYTIRPEISKWEGRSMPGGNSSAAPYTLIEQHLWVVLPDDDAKDGLGEERPVVATVDYNTGKLVGLYLREEPDPSDRARYNSQLKDMGDYENAMQGHQAMQQAEHAAMARLAMPDVPQDEALQLHTAIATQAVPPPTPPTWAVPDEMTGGVQPPVPMRKRAIESFSHGVCIENVDGALGMGIGLLLEQFNVAANILADQFVDSATLANTATGFADAQAMESGEIRLAPGKFQKVRTAGKKLDELIHVIQFPQANSQLMEMLQLQLTSADGVASAPEVLSGEPGKSSETYRGLATRVDQAMKQLTVLAMNFLEFLGQVMRNNARLNAVFLSDSELLDVVDPRTRTASSIRVSRELYAEDLEIWFTADTRFATRQQRITEADQIISLATQAIPPPLFSTVFKPGFLREAVSRSLVARGLHDMIPFLLTPEEAAMPPPVAVPPGGSGAPQPGGTGAPPPGAGPPQPGGPVKVPGPGGKLQAPR
jgi:hypothetical protein